MKKNLVLLVSGILLSSALLVPISVNAESLGNNMQDKSQAQEVIQSDDFSYYENSPYFNVQKNKVTGDTEITITDSNLVKLLNKSGIDTTGFNTMVRSNGVTKIVWHGQARYGNVDIYLSRNVLNGMYSIGINGIAATIGVLFPGIGTAIAGVIAAEIAGHGLFDRGVIYKIRSFKLSDIVYQ